MSAIPMRDISDRNHKYIWDSLAFELDNEDFSAIQRALIEREDEHEAIDNTSRVFIDFDVHGQKMVQPRKISDDVKQQAHKYVDWSCAETIWRVLSKYAEFYSKH